MPEMANQELWYTIFAEGHPELQAYQRFHRWLPSPPRCKLCYAPFRGVGSIWMNLRGKGPSNRNPRYCSACDKFLRAFPGGAEVEMSMVYVDVRDSTPLAERFSPADFGQVMTAFYQTAVRVLNDGDGWMAEVVGDSALAVYPPGFSGPDHARKAVQAAADLVNESITAPDGSSVYFGVGVHTGVVYIGTMTGAEAGIEDLTVLGDNVNIVARLASVALPGEALISEASWDAVGAEADDLERRQLELKGKSASVDVRVVRAGHRLRLAEVRRKNALLAGPTT